MGDRRLRAIAPALAGPALIVVAVVVVLHDVAFGGRMSHQTPDWQSYWLPTHCLLGRTLASGEVPGWNPYSMGGARFAGDPQSGWMYATPMVLFTFLRCDIAARAFFVLQPILAGLGLYGFLRSEGLARAVATTGGLAIALMMAGSDVLTSVPFAGSLAWSALLLAAASRFIAAASWSGRMGWALAVALAWGQLAAAHLSNGLIIGTSAFVLFGVTKVTMRLRDRTLTIREAGALALLLMIALPVVNLAYFIPRLDYLPSSTLGKGYAALQEMTAELQGGPVGKNRIFRAVHPVWGLRFAVPPGAYLGAVCLAMSFGGFWAKKLRPLAAAFSLYAVVSYLAGLAPVARALKPLVVNLPFGEFYLHGPGRFEYALVLALPVLGALGVEAWRRAASTGERVAMVLPGIFLWGVLPLLAGARLGHLVPVGVGALAGGVALAAFLLRPIALAAVPLILAVELSAIALAGQAATPEQALTGLERGFSPLQRLLEPDVSLLDYIAGGPIEQRIAQGPTGRLMTLGGSPKNGPRPTQRYRPMLSEIEVAQGYNPIQELRYWRFVRAVTRERLTYKGSVFVKATPSVLDLMQVRWIASRRGRPPLVRARSLAQDPPFTLYAVRRASPRASFIGSWSTISGSKPALRRVAKPRFDPTRAVVLEQDPGLGRSPAPGTAAGTARYTAQKTQGARVVVRARRPGILLIRNTYDEGWRATLDGRPAEVMPADYLLQGVAVPAGRHVVALRYDDASIRYGIIGSAASVTLLVVAAGLLRIRRRTTPSESRTASPFPAGGS